MSVQVAVAADYFPAYARLPRKAQRKANEFIRKFQQDPKQASIHYEPIVNVVDKQLRSVRVGDDYRAIVRAPERGNTFLLLYIDHHDEAYRWAEGKQVQVHPSTGTLQFFDVEEASAAVTSLSSSPGNEIPEADYEEKRLFSDWSDEQLFTGGVPRMLLPSVREIYTEGDLDKLLPHVPAETAELLTGLAAGYAYDEVVQSILDAPAPTPKEQAPKPPVVVSKPVVRTDSAEIAAEVPPVLEPPTEIEVALTKESTQAQFRVLDEDFDLDKALAHPLDVWRVYLHPSQRKIVQAQTKGPLRITGGAGTGKTVVAMHRAAWLVRKIFTAPDDKVLVTTFTKNLALDIRHNLEKLLEPEDMTRVEVTNIDAWAFDYLRKKGQFLRVATKKHREEAWKSAFDLYGVDGYDLRFCKAEWEAVIQAQGIAEQSEYVRAVRHNRGQPLSRADRRKLWELFSEYRNALEESGVSENIDVIRAARKRLESESAEPDYRSVIVDETQDMSSEALSLIRLAAGPERGNDLLLVGDAHQRIYGRPAPLSQSGINIRGRRSRELTLNYRTTAAICRWSLRTLGSEDYDDLDGGLSSTKGYKSLRKGAAPLVRHFENKAEERDYVVEQVRDLLDSGLLPEEICIVARTKNLLGGGYGPALEKAGIDYEILDQNEPRRSSVRLATMHRVKGLEFPVVFVGAVNDGLVPLSTTELASEDELVSAQAEKQERCLLYVATSRARDQLFVTSYDLRSPFLEGLEEVAPVSEARPQAAPAATADIDLPSGPGSLSEWNLPTRMATWLERKGITTVGGLLGLDPSRLSQEKNLGRKSVADTREEVKRRLGASWEELRGASASLDVASPEDGIQETPEIAARLDEELARYAFPVRFFTWSNKRSLLTFRELMRWEPLQVVKEPKMGRGTVAQARAIVEKRFGHTWEELHRLVLAAQQEPVDTPWDELSTESSGLAAAIALADLSVPEALRAALVSKQCQSVGDAIRVQKAELLSTPGVTERHLKAGRDAILKLGIELEEREARWGTGFFEALREMFAELPTIPRMIVTRRAGLHTSAETLEEIGSTFAVTRERVRQIEKKTWESLAASRAWIEYIEKKCTAVAPSGAVLLAELESHPWWASLAEEPDALDYFCDRLLDGEWRVVKLEQQQWLAKIAQRDLDPIVAAARRTAKKAHYPVPTSELRRDLLGPHEELAPGVREIIWDAVEEKLSLNGEGDEQRALAYGTTKNAQILAYLEKQNRPVSVNEVFSVAGRVGEFPPEVFMLARGVVGLERHFPDYQRWKVELVPVVVRLIQDNGPERQWSCADLVAALREEVDLPEWLEHWHLAAILRRTDEVEYLGRLRVALPGVIEDSSRIFTHDAAEQVLTNNGAPMLWDELAREIRTKLDISDLALTGLLNKPPFMKTAKRTYGLLSRDLPGGVEAMADALDEVEAVLERRQRGLSALFVRKEIAGLSAVHASWTEEISMSVLRSDPRFRLSMAGAVGLSAWEDVRLPSRFELLVQATQKSGGRVSVAAVQERIAAIYGAAPDRTHLGQMANRIGGRLDGDWIVFA